MHAKSSTLYGRSYGVKCKFFSACWVTTISYNYGATLRALRAPLLNIMIFSLVNYDTKSNHNNENDNNFP